MARLQEPEPTLAVVADAEDEESGELHEIVCGVYAEAGQNHGKPVFKKLRCGAGQKNVFIYYYGEGDETSRGWWFGDQVGGDEVWLHNSARSQMPPGTGWVWMDGNVREELRVVSAAEGEQEPAAVAQVAADYSQEAYELPQAAAPQRRAAPQTPRAAVAQVQRAAAAQLPYAAPEEAQLMPAESAVTDSDIPPEWEERLQRVADMVDNAEADVTQALDMAKLAADDELGLDDASAVRALELLAAQAQPLLGLQRVGQTEGLLKVTAPSAVRHMTMELTQRVRKLQTEVKAMEQRLMTLRRERAARQMEEKRRAQEQARVRELEEKHAVEVDEATRLCAEKVEALEEETEKVVVAATPLELDAADYGDAPLAKAVEETEKAAKAANIVLLDVRRFLTIKIATVRRLIPGGKPAALDDLTAMQTKVNELGAKLAPYASIRQRHQQRMQAKKAVEELSDQLAAAELEVEKASMASTPMFGGAEAFKDAEKPLASAQAAVSRVMRSIEAKIKGAPKGQEVFKDSLAEVQERAKQMQERVVEAQQAVRDMQAQALADSLQEELMLALENLDKELQRLTEAEGLFEAGGEADTMGLDVQSIGPAVQARLQEAQGVMKRAQMAVAKAGAREGGPLEVVKETLAEFTSRAGEAQEKLKQFQVGSVGFQRKQFLNGVCTAVAAAEAEVQKFAEAAQALGERFSDEETARAGLQQFAAAEKNAQGAVVAGRKTLVDSSAQMRKLPGCGTAPVPEVSELQTRLNTAQQEIAKFRKAGKDAEERWAAQKVLEAVTRQVEEAHTEYEEAQGAVAALEDDDAPPPEAIKHAEELLATAQAKLGVAVKAVAARSRNARGVVEAELKALGAKLTQAQEGLSKAMKAVAKRRELVRVKELVSQASEKASALEAEISKATEAQAVLSSAAEASTDEAQSALNDSEAAFTTSQRAYLNARTFCAKVMQDVKRLTGNMSEPCLEELKAAQEQVEAGDTKLKELQRDCLEHKRKVQERLSEQRTTAAEAAVKSFAEALAELTEEQLEGMAPEEAAESREKLALVERQASEAVSGTQEFLSRLLNEAKTHGAQGASMTAEVSKRQGRLRQQQAQLATLSRDCADRGRGAEAKRLLRELPSAFERLEADVKAAHTVGGALLAADKPALLAEMRVLPVVVGLQAHMQEGGFDPRTLFAKITAAETLQADELSAFLSELPRQAPSGAFLAKLSAQEAAAAVLRRAGAEAGKGLSEEALEELLRERLVCRVPVPVTEEPEGGTEVGVVEVGEAVEVLERRESPDGTVRVRCLLTRSGEPAGWAVARSTSGKANLETTSSVPGRAESVRAHIEGLCTRIEKIAAEVEKKVSQCASGGIGQQRNSSLSDVRAKLTQLKMQANVHKVKVTQLKKRVSATVDSLSKQLSASPQGAATKSATTQATAAPSAEESQGSPPVDDALQTAATAVASAEEQVNRLIAALKADPQCLQKDESLKQNTKEALEEAVRACSEGKSATEGLSATKDRPTILKLRVDFMKLSSKAATLEKKCRQAVGSAW